ncbi:MAG: hypothetical protein ACFB0C_23720 [Leptolyngbyaceae cyanobacterium]
MTPTRDRHGSVTGETHPQSLTLRQDDRKAWITIPTVVVCGVVSMLLLAVGFGLVKMGLDPNRGNVVSLLIGLGCWIGVAGLMWFGLTVALNVRLVTLDSETLRCRNVPIWSLGSRATLPRGTITKIGVQTKYAEASTLYAVVAALPTGRNVSLMTCATEEQATFVQQTLQARL